jgi:hypothetical protein
VIDEFCLNRSVMINVGDEKGEILDRAVRRASPHLLLELGTYCGYSALRMARVMPADARLCSIEFSRANAAIARRIWDHAGIGDRLTVVVGTLGDGGSRRERLASAFRGLHESGSTLAKSMWNGLSEIEGVTLYGPEPALPRTPTISFTVKGKNSRDVAVALAERGLFVSHGDFYAMTVVERLGLSDRGLVRAGCGVYTTAHEVSRLCEGVRALT